MLNCKKCDYTIRLKRNRTKNGLVNRIYKSQKESSVRRKIISPNYTKEELREWFWNQPNAETLYNNWADSNYDTLFRPSVDRIDDFKGYSFDNIQLITWEENLKKTRPKTYVAVLQYDLNMNFVKEHISLTKAGETINKDGRGIGLSCQGNQKTCGGFIWRYK